MNDKEIIAHWETEAFGSEMCLVSRQSLTEMLQEARRDERLKLEGEILELKSKRTELMNVIKSLNHKRNKVLKMLKNDHFARVDILKEMEKDD